MLQGARESVFTTKADHSFFTEPVSCLVFNAVGKTNVSILVDVHCESRNTHLTLFSRLWPTLLTTFWSQRDKTLLCFCFPLSRFSPFSPTALLLKHNNKHLSPFLSPVGPILLVEPQPKTVDVDDDVTLNCKWAGNPPLTLTWFKKGSNMVRKTKSPRRAHFCSVLVFAPLSQFTQFSHVYKSSLSFSFFSLSLLH